jgi:hypothetical protein
MSNNFYKGMTQEEYNALLTDGGRVWVDDKEFLDYVAKASNSPRLKAVPTTAHLITASDGVTLWSLVPMAEAAVQLFTYCIKPVANDECQVVRMHTNFERPIFVCKFSDLETAEQETAFRYLMGQAELDQGDKEE